MGGAETSNCPSCGAALDRRNPGIKAGCCEYCGTVVMWDEQGLRSTGRVSSLAEGFTRLYTGAAGKVGDTRFEVLGRVRYDFGKGFWDEWYIQRDDDSTAWITEDDHQLCMQNALPIDPGGFDDHSVGDVLELGQHHFLVEEKGLARCLGVEGRVPRGILPGETYRYLDASSPDGALTLGIEYDDEPASAYIGVWLSHADLTLDDEGVDW